MKAIVTVGISASGKTTWAKEYAQKNKGTIVTNRDDLRFSMTGAKDWSQYKFTKSFESLVTTVQRSIISEAAEHGKDVIISDTNLDGVRRAELVAWLIASDFEVEIKYFPISLEEAWKRDSLRANGVGQAVIYRQWKQWLKDTDAPVYTPDQWFKKAIIFDIDGTLAHMNDRKPYDWDKVDEDDVDVVIRSMLWGFQKQGYDIIVVSGRDGVCERMTEEWLTTHRIVYDAFFMRKAGDMRKDTIIKSEIFFESIAPMWNVVAVVDDRPSVVRMWHDIGIPKVIAVGDQNVEF